MPKKAVGHNPLFSSRGASKIMPGKTDNQDTQKVQPISSNSTKAPDGKSDSGKNKIKR